MSYDIVFSDIDGTLLNTKRELSNDTKAQIKRIKEHIPVILISSRMPSAMVHLQKELNIENSPLICYNGGLVLVDNRTVHSTFISIEILENIINFNKQLSVHLSLYHHDEWYAPQDDFWTNRERQNTKVNPVIRTNDQVLQKWQTEGKGAHKIMCMGDEEKVDKIYNFLNENYRHSLHLYRSKPTYIEIAEKSVSKLTAIQYLLSNYYKIDIQNAVAFGDNYNDVDMIKGVGTGVAVGNAKPETLKVADYITLPGKEDGVAEFIKKHIIF